VLDPGGQSKTKFKKLDKNLPVRWLAIVLVVSSFFSRKKNAVNMLDLFDEIVFSIVSP
jgi:hypothetical protein